MDGGRGFVVENLRVGGVVVVSVVVVQLCLWCIYMHWQMRVAPLCVQSEIYKSQLISGNLSKQTLLQIKTKWKGVL